MFLPLMLTMFLSSLKASDVSGKYNLTDLELILDKGAIQALMDYYIKEESKGEKSEVFRVLSRSSLESKKLGIGEDGGHRNSWKTRFGSKKNRGYRYGYKRFGGYKKKGGKNKKDIYSKKGGYNEKIGYNKVDSNKKMGYGYEKTGNKHGYKKGYCKSVTVNRPVNCNCNCDYPQNGKGYNKNRKYSSGNAWRYIVSTQEGKLLTLSQENQIVLSTKHSEDCNQLWYLKNDGFLYHKSSGKVLEAKGRFPGSQLKLATKDIGSDLQRWEHSEHGHLVNAASQLVITYDSGKVTLENIGSIGSQRWIINNHGQVKDKKVLKKVSLEAYPDAVTNDGTPGVYYIQTDEAPSRKILIFLEGGGYCIPGRQGIFGLDCESRCKEDPELCSAATEPYLDIRDTDQYQSVWSEDQYVNPAFHDYFKVYMPYSSSDVYVGTSDQRDEDEGFIFHGKFIFKAFIKDLMKTKWIKQADQVILMGESAGAIGTEANCDLLSEMLHEDNPDVDTKCISDSGSLYPFSVLRSQDCDFRKLVALANQVWQAASDKSCLEEEKDPSDCASANEAYKHIETPILFLMSSQDDVTRFCYLDEESFWSRWRAELARIASNIVEDRPDVGMFMANCRFHISNTNQAVWSEMEVPVVNGSPGETILLKNLIYNFVNGIGPIHAIDNMDQYNENCNL